MLQRRIRSEIVPAWRPAALLVLGALAGSCGKSKPGAPAPLLVYVGGTMRPVLDELAQAYEDETGRKVLLDYGDSGANLVKIRTAQRGDLNVCHDPFQGVLLKEGLASEDWTVALLTPAIAVPKGNPKGIRGLEDLAREGLRVGLTDPEYSTLGHICPVLFRKAGGIEDRVEKNVATRMRMGGQVANAVIQGHLDAAIVWDAVIHVRRDELDAVPIDPRHLPEPGVDAVTSATYGRIDMGQVRVGIQVLACSQDPEGSRAFARFVASARGRAAFAAHGFTPAPEARGPAPETSAPAAEPGADSRGRLLLYSGAGLRPAIEEIVAAFGRRTGVRVDVDYAGSGILVSRIQLSRRGDVFLPGEMEYVEELAAKGLVRSRRPVAWLVPAILVKKGNPAGIRSLRDLARPGLRLGLGNPEACQIGRTAEALFRKNGIDLETIRERTAFSSLTVNELGVQVEVGQIDAAIVWEPIARLHEKAAGTVSIPAEENVVSPVGAAVLSVSEDPRAAEDFVRFLEAEESRAVFARLGYRVSPPEGAGAERPGVPVGAADRP
mgnify:CR=1 FL=1